MQTILLVSSNSIHLWNYLELIQGKFKKIIIITNNRSFDHVNLRDEIYICNFSLYKFVAFCKTILFIRDILRKYQPDIIHIHQANTCALATTIANKFKIPQVLTAWGSDILVTPNLGFLYKLMVKYNLKKASIITSDSLYMASKIRELCPKKNLSIKIANFGIRVCNDYSKKENIIFSNRRHEKLYRIDQIIFQFYNFIQKQSQDWRLIIAGEGSETENLKKIVRELSIDDFVEFVGWIDSKRNSLYYNKARIYVSIPESDATSISLLEALACNCIPIVSNLPANLEWVLDEINGIVIENVDDIDSSFFEKALSIDITMLDKVNQKIISTKAIFDTNQKIFMQIYDELLMSTIK